VHYKLKRRWRDGSTSAVLDPCTLIERLCALVPRPRQMLMTYHGVLAPAADYRMSCRHRRCPTHGTCEKNGSRGGRGRARGSPQGSVCTLADRARRNARKPQCAGRPAAPLVGVGGDRDDPGRLSGGPGRSLLFLRATWPSPISTRGAIEPAHGAETPAGRVRTAACYHLDVRSRRRPTSQTFTGAPLSRAFRLRWSRALLRSSCSAWLPCRGGPQLNARRSGCLVLVSRAPMARSGP
jgi:hypothetical protein